MQNDRPAASRGQFWRYALPSMFSQLLNSCFIIVDGLFIGQNLGDAGLAAINVAWPIVAVIQSVSLAVGTGGAVRLATARGRGDETEALAARGNTLVLLAVCAAALEVGLGLTYPRILPLIGANAELYPLAAAYSRVACLLSPLQVFSCGLLPLVRSAGRTVGAMTVTVGGLLGNIFLDWLFIQRFQWGLPGAALATGLSQGLCALAALPLLLAHRGWPLRLRQFVPARRMVRGILHSAVAPFGLSISTSAILLVTNLQALRHGRHVAVAQLGDNGMPGVIQRDLVGRAGAALYAVEEETAANLVGIAQQVVVHGNRGGRGRALDGDRHAEAEGRIEGQVHFLHGFLNGIEALMIRRRVQGRLGDAADGLNMRRDLGGGEQTAVAGLGSLTDFD